MSHVKAWGTAQNPPRLPFRPRNVVLTGLAMLTASLLVGCGGTNEPDGDNVDDIQSTAPSTFAPSHKGGDPVFGSPSGSVENVVDNIHGVQVFGSSSFDAFKGVKDRIPYNTKVNVVCYVTNNTGQYGSVNALYRIKGGEWDGGWIPANVMLNDPTAKVGDVNTPALDPRVKPCS